jgi:hypothetical protein
MKSKSALAEVAMFIFEEDYSFEWPVKVKYPSAGGEDVREFTGVFRLPTDELEVYERPDKVTMTDLIEIVRDRLGKYWIGWSGIETATGDDLPFSEAMRARLLLQAPVRQAVELAFSEAVLGIREKN